MVGGEFPVVETGGVAVERETIGVETICWVGGKNGSASIFKFPKDCMAPEGMEIGPVALAGEPCEEGQGRDLGAEEPSAIVLVGGKYSSSESS